METIEHHTSVYTVSQLTREVRELLETAYPTLWISGELSNVSTPGSGHIYFSLKDENCQVRAAFFKNYHRKLTFTPQNGQKVLVKAQISLYENRGDFQLIIEHMEEMGTGLLQKAFEELKKRLDKDGLFNQEYKKPIPAFPRRVGVITSPTGAVIRDILTTLKRRFPRIAVIIYPTAVQGNQAAKQIVEAIYLANQRNEVDVLILARGGGSLEDLWPFNEESVARAIFASTIPLISAIGHEVDVTIADFVADKRAPTPTAAAELVSPEQTAMLNHLCQLEQRMQRWMLHILQQMIQRMDYLTKRLTNPQNYLRQQKQQLHYLKKTLTHHIQQDLKQIHNQLERYQHRLLRCNPHYQITSDLAHIHQYQQKITHMTQLTLHTCQQKFAELAASLDALSPLSTLKRGYAIVEEAGTGKVIESSQQVKIGETVTAFLANGELDCVVTRVRE